MRIYRKREIDSVPDAESKDLVFVATAGVMKGYYFDPQVLDELNPSRRSESGWNTETCLISKGMLFISSFPGDPDIHAGWLEYLMVEVSTECDGGYMSRAEAVAHGFLNGTLRDTPGRRDNSVPLGNHLVH